VVRKPLARGTEVNLASFCAGLQVSTQPLARTATGVDALAMIRIPDPGMEAFYRRLIGDLLARTETTQPFPHLPTIIRAMIWDFLARTGGSPEITLWFGCDSPIAAAAPLLSSGSTLSLKDTGVCVVFRGYRDFKREAQIWPMPFDPADGFARQRDEWGRLRNTGGQFYSVAYSAALPVDLMAKSFRRLVEVSGPPNLLLLDTFFSLDTSALDEFNVPGWWSETIVDRAFSTEPTGEGWRILALRFMET
jgi:hypothetical protein